MKVTQELKETHIPRQVGFAETPKHSQIGLQQRKEALRPILMHIPTGIGSALHVMLFLENLIRALLIFNGLRSLYCQRALLGYHYPAMSRACLVTNNFPLRIQL